MKTENKTLKEKSKTIETLLELFGNGEVFPSMEISNGVIFNRNFDYCAAYIENEAQMESFKNFAFQLGFTENKGTKDGISMFKVPYQKMTNKKSDTQNYAKEHNLKPTNVFEDVKGSFYANEDVEIERYKRELYKKGYASYSEPFDNAMLKKFPNSNHSLIQNILKVRKIKSDYKAKLAAENE